MPSTNEKIGHLIAQVRQEKGFTQAEFARRLNTSQSAVNRMEHGRQNLSMETLGRISDVLNKQLISLNSGAINLRIEGGNELKGEITLKTSKNATVALLCASLLNKGTTRLKNVARIEEVNRLVEVLTSIGVSVRWIGDSDLEIKPPQSLTWITWTRPRPARPAASLCSSVRSCTVPKSFKSPTPAAANLDGAPYYRTCTAWKSSASAYLRNPATTKSLQLLWFPPGRWCYTSRAIPPRRIS